MTARITQDNLPGLLARVQALTRKQLLVGIPADNKPRDPVQGQPQQPNNAVIGYVQEFGDPARNIPARPFLVPGVQNAAPRAVERLQRSGEAALRGDMPAMDAGFVAAGLLCQNAVRRKLTEGPFVPLSEATLRERAARGRKGAIAELARRDAGGAADALDADGASISNANARPLVDTGQLRQALTYVVRERR